MTMASRGWSRKYCLASVVAMPLVMGGRSSPEECGIRNVGSAGDKSRPRPRANREVIAGRLDLDLPRARVAIEQIQERPVRYLRQMFGQQKPNDSHPVFFGVGERQRVRDLLLLVNSARLFEARFH